MTDMRRRVAVAAAALVVLAGFSPLTTAAPVGAAPSGSTAPTPAPLARKVAADAEVAELAAQIESSQKKIADDQVVADNAQQEYTLQIQRRGVAKKAAAVAEKTRAAMALTVADQRAAVSTMVSESYISGDNMPGASLATLITASDPQALVSRLDSRSFVAGTQSRKLDEYRTQLDDLTQAEADAAKALKDQNEATAAAAKALDDAKHAMATAKAEKDKLNKALAAAKQDAAAAAVALAAERAKLAWVTPQQAVALNELYRKQAAAAASVAMAPNPGHWTPEMGQSVVNRALQWLGTPYSWNGGNYAGPTRGMAVDYDSRNDGGIVGFDCSGLVLYAWGPYLHMPHLSKAQYSRAGSMHPTEHALMPGDLVFWSAAGTPAGISHVAMYIGNGNVIQAPASGDIVKVTPLHSVESGLFGFTRPMT